MGTSTKRSLLALSLVALLGLGLGACGATGGVTDSTSASRSSTAQSSTAGAGARAPAKPTGSANTSSFRGDEDDDESASNHTNVGDKDADSDNDTHENTGYRDSDDRAAEAFGHAPRPADKRAIEALIGRYFAAAAAADGATACSLIYSKLEKAVVEDYGQGAGPAYARGGTCAVVMSKLFAHAHAQLAGGVSTTAVRVSGTEGRALLGSPTMPAALMPVEREGATWKVASLLANPMP